MSATRRPWMKFYPADWRADQALRICSLSARGLWVECMALMHEAEPYGHLTINGHPIDHVQLAKLVASNADEIEKLLCELEATGVFSRNRKGVILSRRMVKDGKKAETARKNGKFGGNPTLSKQTEKPPWDNPKVNGEVKPHAQKDARGQIPESREDKPPPSKEGSPPLAAGVVENARKGKRGPGTRLPSDWTLCEAGKDYARQRGFSDGQTEDIAANFLDYWTAGNGRNKTHLDWLRAWQTWVRNTRSLPSSKGDREEAELRVSGMFMEAAKAADMR